MTRRFARRDLLGAGGSALAASLSGCASSVSQVGGPPEVREQSGQTVERSIHTRLTDESADPAFATLVVGERGFHRRERRPHQVWFRNETGRVRAITVEIADSLDADSWFGRTYDFDPNARLVAELRRVRRYAVTVRVSDQQEETVEVPKSRFDCNASATDVVVREQGIESMGVTTEMGCPGLW